MHLPLKLMRHNNRSNRNHRYHALTSVNERSMLSLIVRVSASVAASRGSRCLGVVSASRHKLDRPVKHADNEQVPGQSFSVVGSWFKWYDTTNERIIYTLVYIITYDKSQHN